MDTNERIKDQLEKNPVMLYMKGSPDFPQCGFSSQAVSALKMIGKPFSYINIFEDPEIIEGLKIYSNWPTFPQLYVNGDLVGGCDIIIEMYETGELAELLEKIK
ncbi:MAG: Grx4 family monothiol glutaredoxin [Pseudomonadota bacterium]|nr:Grx4 family monothiol glutaredoxin [Pseudomonadota bacterium]